MRRWFRKPIEIPAPGAVQILEEVQLWMVSWQAWRGGKYPYGRFQSQFRAFPREADAEAFAASLRAAFVLLHFESDTTVTVERQDHP